MYYLGTISLFFTNLHPKFPLVFWSLHLSSCSTATWIYFQSSDTYYNTFWRFFLEFCSQFISNSDYFYGTDSSVTYPPPHSRLFCCFNSLQLLTKLRSNWFKSFILLLIWAFPPFINHWDWCSVGGWEESKIEVDFPNLKKDNLSNRSSNSSK